MREILFRVWVKSEKKIGKVTSILFSDTQYTLVRYRYIGNSGKKIDDQSNIDDSGNGTVILMQYTGLKDKNGKRIFEGDIVKTPSSCGMSEYCISAVEKKNGCWVVMGGNLLFNYQRDIEVIGNRHDNPELLKE